MASNPIIKTEDPPYNPPSSILIIGSGAFGLSTAYELATNPIFTDTTITVVDRLPFPASDGASVRSLLHIPYLIPPPYTQSTPTFVRF